MKEFLEEEKLKFCLSGIENDGGRFIDFDGTVEWIENHDTRLINFVLDEVKREVEKKSFTGTIGYYDELKVVSFKDISTIIDQLKLK